MMNNTATNRRLVTNFMDMIWNKNRLEKIDDFIHPDFVDHSLPPNLPANKEGLMAWVAGTGKSFNHQSVIEEQVTEGDKSMIKFRLFLEHTGIWRGIQPTGAKISVVGYRHFRLQDGKIMEHWALLDGNSIENQLRGAAHGCKIQE